MEIKKINVKEIPEDIINLESPMQAIQKELARKVSKSYDDFVFSILEQFGINRENWREWLGRVTVFRAPYSDNYYIDGNYVFSIVLEPVVVNTEDKMVDDGKIEISIRYRVEIYDHLLDMRKM